MKILIDGIVYSSAPSGGVFNYFNELIPRLGLTPGVTVEVFLPNESATPPLAGNAKVSRSVLPSGKWLPHGTARRLLGSVKRKLEAEILRRRLRTLDQTVFHTSTFTLSPFPHIPRVTTIYDMISELYADMVRDLPGGSPDSGALSHLLQASKDKARAVQNSERLIAISECTKKDLVEIFNISPERVDVCPLGADTDFFSTPAETKFTQQLREKYQLDAPFVFYLGGRLHHKNFIGLVEAFAESGLASSYVLGVAGPQWSPEEMALLKKHNLSQHVRLMRKVPQAELPALFQMAEFFVFPSLYEGFGLPLVEAMAAGCAVTASNTGPFPEIAQTAAHYFDPKNPSSMAKALQEMTSPALRASLRLQGSARARLYTWERSVDLHLKCYRHALGVSSPGVTPRSVAG